MSFFATYCEPCKKEMPELSRLYDTYKDQGLGVMLVSIDKGDEQRQTIIDLAKENKVAFPVMHDRYQVVARRYAAERLPYMLMLDPTGTVKVVHVGYTDDLKANLENEVRGHLGLEPLPPPAPPAPATPEKGTKGAKGTEKAGDKATPEKAPKGPKAPAKS
jgi:thiol-disulfide isomerase/thioredoxin